MAEAAHTMGTANSKPGDTVRSINRDVSSIRSSIRSPNRRFTSEHKDQLVRTLVKCSNEVNSLKGRVKPLKLEQVQANISNAMQEVLSKEPDLDVGAVETSSFIQVPLSKRQMSNKDLTDVPPKRQKNTQPDSGKIEISTLQDIEEKLKTLKPQIKVSIEMKDINQLRVHQETIRVLATDLEMIHVREHTPLGDRKKKLDNSITNEYKKIGRAMKDIRREKDINYLTKQNKRILTELEEIRKELREIDSVVATSLQSKDFSAVNGLKENILMLRQRLSSIQTGDETAKQLQKQLINKLTEISKIIEDNTRSNGETEIMKAKESYEDIVKNIASGNNIDKNEIKVKLESLQSFISSITDDNEIVLRQKQQLLNNVRQSFSLILEEEEKIQNVSTETDNSETNEIKTLDKLYNNLLTVQNNLNPTSPDDFIEIDKILSNISKSVEEKRIQIAECKSLPSSLNKFNRSTPNLSSPKPQHRYGSNTSIDLAGQSLIKARAKVYNLSTPQIQNINDQPVVLRNKQFYQNRTLDERRPFSQIEEIKTQINYIKEKFEESPQKQHLKNKLESYIEIIKTYVHHQNQRIASSAQSLMVEIQEMLKCISQIPDAMNSPSTRRQSIEMSFENVVAIQRAVEDIEKTVNGFKGKRGDAEYKRITEELSQCRKYLREINIPPKYDMIQQQREEVLNKIEVVLNILESRCFNYYEDPDVANTKKKLNSLKDKVGRFSGAYRGVLYNQIEKDLNKLLVDIDDKITSEDITKDIEKHLKILEHKSTKDQSFRRTVSDAKSRNEEEEKLIRLKSDLLNIKSSIDTTPTNAVNLFIGLKSRLDLVKLGLDQLRFTLEDEEKQKDLLYNEVEALKNMVEAKISLAKQSVRQWPLEQDLDKKNLEDLSKIEEKFKTLKPEIESFIGTTSDNKFYELDENSIRLILKMDKLQFQRGCEAHNKKIELLKEIYHYGDLLDQRAKESEDLLEVETSVRDIEKNFARNVKLNDLDSLEEKVIGLKTRINNSQFNNHLLQRKQACVNAIEALFQKISTHKKQSLDQTIQNVDLQRMEADHLISNIELQFGTIKKEINSFFGSGSDHKYYVLDSNLTALFLKLDSIKLPENSEIRPRKIVLLKEMHAYTDILRKKAQEGEVVQEIDKQLGDIGKKMQSHKGSMDELKDLEQELKTVQGRMEKIKIGDETKPIEQKLDTLIGQYSRLHAVNSSNDLNRRVPQNLQDPTVIRFSELEKEIYFVRQKVTTFINIDTSDEYRKIEDTLLRLKMRLGKIDTRRNTEFIRKQNELEKQIDECLNILDERSLETGSIIEIEQILDKVNEDIHNATRDDERSVIDEKLIALQVKLGKLRVNKDLAQRKGVCADRIMNYLKLLKN